VPLPAGDDFIELALFGSQEMEVVIDDVAAERRAREGALLQLGGRVPEVHGDRRQLIGLIDVALEHIRGIDLILDTVKPGSYGRGVDQVRVGIGARDATFDAQRGTVTHHPESGGAVVVAPGDSGWRERPRLIALV